MYLCIYIYMDICNSIVTSLLKNAQYHKQESKNIKTGKDVKL